MSPSNTLATTNGYKPNTATALDAVRTLMTFCGYSSDQPGTSDTPRRVVDALAEMTSGQHLDPASVLARQFAAVDSDHDEMIVVTGIDFVALCEHHMMPFTGTATVGYVPKPGAPVVGISKLARVVDMFAHRLTMQERMTRQITAALDGHVESLGSGCIVRGVHSCMSMRGVRKRSAVTVTSSLTGVLRDDTKARNEFLAITSGGS